MGVNFLLILLKLEKNLIVEIFLSTSNTTRRILGLILIPFKKRAAAALTMRSKNFKHFQEKINIYKKYEYQLKIDD